MNERIGSTETNGTEPQGKKITERAGKQRQRQNTTGWEKGKTGQARSRRTETERNRT